MQRIITKVLENCMPPLTPDEQLNFKEVRKNKGLNYQIQLTTDLSTFISIYACIAYKVIFRYTMIFSSILPMHKYDHIFTKTLYFGWYFILIKMWGGNRTQHYSIINGEASLVMWLL